MTEMKEDGKKKYKGKVSFEFSMNGVLDLKRKILKAVADGELTYKERTAVVAILAQTASTELVCTVDDCAMACGIDPGAFKYTHLRLVEKGRLEVSKRPGGLFRFRIVEENEN